MFNYAQNLDTFFAKAEKLLSKLTLKMLSDDVTLSDKNYLYIFGTLLDTLHLDPSPLTDVQIETIISYLLKNYEIDCVAVGPYNDLRQFYFANLTGGLTPHTHPINEVINLWEELNAKLDWNDVETIITPTHQKVPTSQAVIDYVNDQVGNVEVGLTEAITSAVEEGGISIGQEFEIGTTFTEMFKKLLTAQAVPPTATISISGTTILEVGTTAVNIINVNFTPNDAGSALTFEIFRKLGSGGSYASIETDSSETENLLLTEAVYYYRGTVTYAAGNPALSNPILAGSINTSEATIEGARAYFAGTSTNPASIPSNSADVRAGTKVGVKLSNGGAYNISVPATTRIAWFAYDADLGSPTSIKHVETNFEYLDEFTVTTVNVNGLSGYTAKTYNLVYWVMDGPWPSTATFRLTT